MLLDAVVVVGVVVAAAVVLLLEELPARLCFACTVVVQGGRG